MDSLRSVPHAAGTRQTERAVEAGNAAYVLLAQDAEERVKNRISALCAVYGVEVKRADSMKELGRLCGIAVGCAACAVLNNFRYFSQWVARKLYTIYRSRKEVSGKCQLSTN